MAVLRDVEESFATPTERLQRVVNSLAIEMFAGLACEDASKVRMLLTCVDLLPDRYMPMPFLLFVPSSISRFIAIT